MEIINLIGNIFFSFVSFLWLFFSISFLDYKNGRICFIELAVDHRSWVREHGRTFTWRIFLVYFTYLAFLVDFMFILPSYENEIWAAISVIGGN